MRAITAYTESAMSLIQGTSSGFESQESKGMTYFIVSHIFILLFIIAVFRTIFTPPGYVPEDWNAHADDELAADVEIEKKLFMERFKSKRSRGKSLQFQDRSVALDESTQQDSSKFEGTDEEQLLRKDFENLEDPQAKEHLNRVAFHNAMNKRQKRYCAHCQMFKPQRTHHCRQCNRCILKMDHHCPWVGNCVGYANYKYFINMVAYGVILLWFMVGTYTEAASDTLWNLNVGTGTVFLICFTYTLNIALALVITAFFTFHMWLVVRGKTTLEFVEDKKGGDYNDGLLENLKTAFGTNYLAWFIPIAPTQKQNGLDYKNNLVKEQKPIK